MSSSSSMEYSPTSESDVDDMGDPEDIDLRVRETFFSLYSPGFDTQYANPLGVHSGKHSYLMKAEKTDAARTKVMLKFPITQLDVYEDCLMTLREVKYMSLMNHQNVRRLRSVGGKKSEVCALVYIEMDYMDHSLESLVNTPSEYFNIVADSNVKCMFQILSGLAYIHSAQLVHRNMEPSNILWEKLTGTFKIADLHKARKIAGVIEHGSRNVGTSSYMAPETVLKPSCQSPAMDIYAAGLMLIEVIRLRMPFLPNRSGVDHIEDILKNIGTPDDEDLVDVSTESGKEMVRFLAYGKPKQLWSDIFVGFPENATSLLEELLKFAGSMRITAANALQHVYFAAVRPAGWTAPTYDGPPLEDYPPTIPMLTIIRTLNDSITTDLTTEEHAPAAPHHS